ncbi:MAG TPA: zinc-dependent alcohol dehydrogenase family protein [Baekduia sp.]|nr:zinc-dependent alcohol dehydrogenase family protein [Baekduia sp.]HMJ37177.1 zinc-dependent alcohol dehydrogenase family protein [Baekduia sp.]
MVLDRPGTPLRLTDLPEPVPGPGQVLLRVRACGVCRTDLHVSDGEVPQTRAPLVLGHQIVAERTDADAPGRRVGVPWLGWTDGTCRYCAAGQENLCEHARFTGRDIDGGFAEWAVADERFCLPLGGRDGVLDDVHVAPLLCAGLIGLRTLRAAGDPARVGLYGFGAAAHLVSQIAVWEGREVYAFTRPGDERGQAFAREQGAVWAGGSDTRPDVQLDAALIFAPAGELVPHALRAVRRGGTVVCGGIHMSDIPSFPYSDLWEERVLRSVANLTRADGHELLALAPRVPLHPQVTPYPLERAQDALDDLRSGALKGAAVVVP